MITRDEFPKIKVLVFMLFFCGMNTGLDAQQKIIEKTFRAEPDEKIVLNLRYGETIQVNAWSKDEVNFRAIVEINGGRLNDALIVNETDDKNGIRIDVRFDNDRLKKAEYDDKGRCRHYTSYSWSNIKGGPVVCSNIIYEISMPEAANLHIESISADMELTGLAGPVYARSVSGFVDMSWPENRGANISLHTVTGEAYSNLQNLKIRNRKEKAPLTGYKLVGTINRGGPDIQLESVSGNIYLRKGSI